MAKPGLRQRDGGLVDIKVEPLLRSLHGDPHYAALLEKMRLHPDVFVRIHSRAFCLSLGNDVFHSNRAAGDDLSS
jgi:hypothetical protein